MKDESEEAAIRVAHAFAGAINRQSPDEIVSLMTDDHVFFDGMGTRVADNEKMRTGWGEYFAMFPDYTITIEESFARGDADGDVVAMLGAAQGTYAPDGVLRPENRWQIPAAWRAVVRGSRIAEWRVYADNEPVRQIMMRDGRD